MRCARPRAGCASSLRRRRRRADLCRESVRRSTSLASILPLYGLRVRAQLLSDPGATDGKVLDAQRGGDVERHAVAEEVVDPLGVGVGELLGEVDELGVGAAHAGAHDVVVAGGVGLVLEHQEVAVADQHLLVSAAHRVERVLAVLSGAPFGVVGGGAAERLGDALKAALQRGEEQVELAREEAEDVRLRDADATRDALYGRSMQAAVRELVHSGGDQLLAPLSSGYAPARGLGGGAHASFPTTTGSRALAGPRIETAAPASAPSVARGSREL